MKKFVWVVIFSFFTMALHANPFSISQPKKKTSRIDKSRILLGPGFGFGAAQRAFSFSLSPSVAYCFTNNFHVGTTLGFNYYQQAVDYDYYNTTNNQYEQVTYKFKLPAYSFSVFARYMIANMFVIGIEPELNNTKYVSNITINPANGRISENKTRLTVGSFLVNVGYTRRFGNYGYQYIMVGYDLVQNPNARYFQTLDYKMGLMIPIFNK